MPANAGKSELDAIPIRHLASNGYAAFSLGSQLSPKTDKATRSSRLGRKIVSRVNGRYHAM